MDFGYLVYFKLYQSSNFIRLIALKLGFPSFFNNFNLMTFGSCLEGEIFFGIMLPCIIVEMS